MTKPERMKLAKILSQTATESDAIALLSVRKACAMIKASGETWQQVLAVEPLGPVVARSGPLDPHLHRPATPVRQRMQRQEQEAGVFLQRAFDKTFSAFGKAFGEALTRKPGGRL